MHQMEIYASLPLAPEKREIRLLRLLPGKDADPLSAELIRVSLNDEPSFSVLSYSWGSHYDKSHIEIHGGDFEITINLHQCLTRLRDEMSPLDIWVDAVCIDQDSNAEKNTQVPLMKHIYRVAEKEYVWLGESTPGLDLVFSWARIIASREQGHQVERLEQIGDETGATPAEILQGLKEFFGLAWFRRTWILQEFALPHEEPIFVCGHQHIEWKILRIWGFFLFEANSKVIDHSALASSDPAWQQIHHIISSQKLRDFGTLRDLFSDEEVRGKGLQLSALISLSRNSLATDPRDKIYGIMGLAADVVTEKIVIDYDISVEDLYERACRYLIFEECKLNILSNQSMNIRPNWEHTDEKPPTDLGFHFEKGDKVSASWIRDFTYIHGSFAQSPLLADWHKRCALYDASLHSRPTPGPEVQPRLLSICGTEVGVVREAVRAWYMLPGKIQYFKAWSSVLDLYFRSAGGRVEADSSSLPASQQNGGKAVTKFDTYDWDLPYSPPGVAAMNMKEAIWRTILGDKLSDADGINRAPPWCGLFFDAYMRSQLGEDGVNLDMPKDSASSIEEALATFSKFQVRLSSMVFRRAAFSTTNGFIGLGPDHIREGDLIVVLSGGDVPFALRPWNDGYVLIGECYVEGVMYGELIKERQRDGTMHGSVFNIR